MGQHWFDIDTAAYTEPIKIQSGLMLQQWRRVD